MATEMHFMTNRPSELFLDTMFHQYIMYYKAHLCVIIFDLTGQVQKVKCHALFSPL